jgi:signal transduction histidine kinase
MSPASKVADRSAEVLVEMLLADDPRQLLAAVAEQVRSVPGLPQWLPILAAKLARLTQLERDFQATLETEKLNSLAEFAAGAGHEINNPLAIIAGRAQLLLADEADPERRRELALINAQVRRAHEMIADLWLFARPPRPEPHSVDLVPLVDRVIEELGPQAAERGVSLRRVGEPGPLPAEVDPVQIGVALVALCKNSLEAIGRDGQIEIGLCTTGDDVQIRVSDTGPGITPDQRPHIFDPFYSARQAGRGLGMGLSKCWRIVTNHGGSIAVRSEPGQGAEFVITLPHRAPKNNAISTV